MLDELTASLGSYTRLIASLINVNVNLFSRTTITAERDSNDRPQDSVDLPASALALLRVFSYEALLGPGAPSLMSEAGQGLAAGDPGHIQTRWREWLKEKRPFTEAELADRHLLKLSQAGRPLLVRTGPGASVLEWEAFGPSGDGWNGDWSVSPNDGLLLVSIGAGSYRLHVVASRRGVHYGYEPESDSLFLVAVPSGRRKPREFLKITSHRQARLVELRRRDRANEVDPFRRESRWPGEWTRSDDKLHLVTHSEGYRYAGTFEAPDPTGIVWGNEIGTPVDGSGQSHASRILMIPIE